MLQQARYGNYRIEKIDLPIAIFKPTHRRTPFHPDYGCAAQDSCEYHPPNNSKARSVIGQTVSHYNILDRPPTSSQENGTPSGQVSEGDMSQISQRLPACRRAFPPSLALRRTGRQVGTFSVSAWKFEDPTERSESGRRVI